MVNIFRRGLEGKRLRVRVRLRLITDIINYFEREKSLEGEGEGMGRFRVRGRLRAVPKISYYFEGKRGGGEGDGGRLVLGLGLG